MNKSIPYLVALALGVLSMTALWAQQPEGTAPTPPTPPMRELFVPFNDLPVVLSNDAQRLFMTREEFAELRRQAKQETTQPLPQNTALLSAAYQTRLEPGRAIIEGEYRVEVLAEGLHALPLQFSGVGLRQARLDDEPAKLWSAGDGQLQLIVSGRGVHVLKVQLTAPVATAAAQQSLSLQLPTPPATTFHLTVPGNVEMKSGAPIISRRVDDAAKETHFELLPSNGPMNLVMSLNNKRLRDETMLLARGVLISEVTSGYQRLHATVSMNILHGSADEFRIRIPADYEVTQVTTPLLARWNIQADDSPKQSGNAQPEDNNGDASSRILVVKLRELATDQVVIQLRADRLASQLKQWQAPGIEPLSVAGFAAVVGVLLEERLACDPIEASNLIAIDNQILAAALPESVLVTEPGTPKVRVLTSYYAADSNYELKTSFLQPAARIKVATSAVVTVDEQGLDVDGNFVLTAESEKLFSFDFTLPEGWSLTRLTTADGKPLDYERHASQGTQRVRARLPGGLAINTPTTVSFQAALTPPGWLRQWDEQTLELPHFSLQGNQELVASGAIAVRVLDDLKAQPLATSGLIVISDQEKSQYGCAHVPVDFAWRYTAENWQGSLKMTRKSPRMVGRVISFLQISPDALTAHYELLYDVEQARAQRLEFSLPATTPTEINVRGLGDTVVKETLHQTAGDRRQWTVTLAEKKLGRLRLAVDFTQPLSPSQLSSLLLPDALTLNTDYQSGLVAVEGHSELDIEVSEHPRVVDLGELIDAEYQPGKRLLGVYSYTGSAMRVVLKAQRRDVHGLPTTIVQRAEFLSLLGVNGSTQTAARYALRTKAQYLEVNLPDGAELWSIMVDGTPALPERQEDHLVVSLPVKPADQLRDLRVVYEEPARSISLRGSLQLKAPALWQRAERDSERQLVPTADLRWETILPAGYQLVHSGGTVTVTSENQPPALPLMSTWQAQRWPRTLGRWRNEYVGRDVLLREERSPRGASGRDLPKGLIAPMDNEDGTFGAQPSAQANDLSQAVDPFAPPTQAAVPALPPVTQAQPPIPQPPVAPAPPSDDAFAQTSLWAIEGLRCLDIDLRPNQFGDSISFTSLGVEPVIEVTLMNELRWRWLGAACGLGIFLIGLWRAGSSLRARLRLISLSLLAGLLVALVTGWTAEMESVIVGLLAGSAALIVTSLVSGLVRRFYARWNTRQSKNQLPDATTSLGGSTVAGLILMLCTTTHTMAQTAEPTPPVVTNLTELAAMIDALPDKSAVSIPDDAIVVPYDPDAELPHSASMAGSEKILVPYAVYSRLWQAAHPEVSLKSQPPVVPYAWSNARYATRLADGDTLAFRGTFTIETFSDAPVAIPLALGGGVLENLLVDNQPGKVHLVEAIPPQAQSDKAAPAAGETMLMLYLTGKGVKQLAIDVRLKVQRRGGWHMIEGTLPAPPATDLAIEVVKPDSEVRLNGSADRLTHEIEKADQVIETSLPADGHISWQWRTKLTEASIDQGLSVRSQAIFDVQEDGLHFAWRGDFEFRSGRRETFTLTVPGDYLVEKVVGNNLRGWNIARVGNDQQLTIDLLTAVTVSETLTIYLYRQQELAHDDESETQITVPGIRVPDAMLQQGLLTIRRSRLLDVRSGQQSGLTRIDTPNLDWLGQAIDASPLPLVTFQAFAFSQVPYEYQLSVQRSQSSLRVMARTLLSLSQQDSSLETQLTLDVQQRQLYHLQLNVPANWHLDTPALPMPYEWTKRTENGQQVVDIYLGSSALGSVPLVLRGRLDQGLSPGNDGVIAPVSLPRISVVGADQQTGDIVITSDPAFAIRAENLNDCDTGLLGMASSWLADQHQKLAQVLVHYNSDAYSGQLTVTPRTPQVKAFSVSNIKLTDRSIEETIYFEFTIRTAGIRQLSVVVPSGLASAKVRGPMMRSHTWTPLNNDPQSPVRLQIELQEEVMGQYSLILEHDRLLTNASEMASIPTIETGTTDHRFVTLENASRDELVIDQSIGLERLQRSQSQFNLLTSLLGSASTEAFVVTSNSNAGPTPKLTYSTKDRATVETVGARIGIAQTTMVVDRGGVYRASLELRMENRTEQFVEIELPPGAKLWTVTVAGEAVKPMTSSTTAAGQRIRLPLVKTAAGDLDYPIIIKYGGQVSQPGALATTRFPLARTININVELSQVRLHLPPGMQWWNFGGSMSRVQSEDELQAGWIAFRTKQLMELTQLAGKAANDDFSRVRALNNIQQLGQEVQKFQSLSRGSNELLQKSLEINSSAWFEAQKELSKPSAATSGSPGGSNRDSLNQRVEAQSNTRSYNVANSAYANFSYSSDQGQVPASKAEFDTKWLSGNSLETKSKVDSQAPQAIGGQSRIILKGKDNQEKSAVPALPAEPKPQAKQEALPDASNDKGLYESRLGRAYRYQQRLNENNAASRATIESGGGGMQAAGQQSGGFGGMANSIAPNNAAPNGMMGGGMMGSGAEQSQLAQATQQAGQQMAGIANAYQTGAFGLPPALGYLTSLDADLPVRGDEFLFTTPRGASEITVQGLSTQTITRWIAIGVVCLVGAVALRLTRRVAPRR